MKSLCITFPGKYGDTAWACSVVRAIKRTNPDYLITLALSDEYSSVEFVDFLKKVAAEYLHDVIQLTWEFTSSAPLFPYIPPPSTMMRLRREFDLVIHLGYRGWPISPDLPTEIFHTALKYIDIEYKTRRDFECNAPWFVIDKLDNPVDIVFGFTPEYREQKTELYRAITDKLDNEISYAILGPILGWEHCAKLIASSKLFVGDQSAYWVLANAFNVPALVIEPNIQRQHPTFYLENPRNKRIPGPEFNVNSIVDEIRSKLK